MKHAPAPTPAVGDSFQRPQLGDMLQRLALIAPHDLYAIALIVTDALDRAEIEHSRNRMKGTRQC